MKIRTTTSMFVVAFVSALAGSASAQNAGAPGGPAGQPAGAAGQGAAAADPNAQRCKDTGDHGACAAAGAAVETTAPDTALELYTAACTKRPDECFTLLSYGQRMFRRKDGAPRGAWVLEKACELKSAAGCTMLGVELDEGEHGVMQDLAKAERLYERACELGVPRGCLLAAAMIEDLRGATKRDAPRAAKLRQRADQLMATAPRPSVAAAEVAQAESACRKTQDAPRCLVAGAALQETDAVKAEEVYRIGCAADKPTCGLWAFAVDRFRKDDPSRATRILEQGCLDNTAAACLVLAELHHVGFRSVPRNEQRATELYQKACTDAMDAGACRTIAARHRQGIGVSGGKNATRADELAARGAKLDEELDKPVRDAQEKFAKDAAQLRIREAYQRELERRRGEWRAFAERARARAAARMARLQAAEQGQQGNPPPSLVMADGEASKAREGAIRRMAKGIFP